MKILNILHLVGSDVSMRVMRAMDGNSVQVTCIPLTSAMLDWADFIVAYGYRHLLPADVCERFDGRAVNLHIGYLPFNRGAHPNVWSAVEGTPSGVSLHYIDKGIDTGDIIEQRVVELSPDDTLAESHRILCADVEDLFAGMWESIRDGECPRKKQTSRGTFHLTNQLPHLPDGWNTKRGYMRSVECV